MGCNGCELWAPAKGVRKCYAGVQTEKILRMGPAKGWPDKFDSPKLFLKRMDEAERWTDLTGVERPDKPWIPKETPRLVFLDDMGDTFASGMGDDWLAPMVERMAKTPHVWMFLTKRPSKQRQFFDRVECPANVWCGTSITGDQPQRIEELLETKCGTRFLSYEPMLADCNLDLIDPDPDTDCKASKRGCLLDLVIFGGESGPEPAACGPCDVGWMQHQIDECDAAGVKVFVKQLGSNPRCAHMDAPENRWLVDLKDKKGGDWREWPEWLRRRELPKANGVQRQETLL
jgi:protein gp37